MLFGVRFGHRCGFSFFGLSDLFIVDPIFFHYVQRISGLPLFEEEHPFVRHRLNPLIEETKTLELES